MWESIKDYFSSGIDYAKSAASTVGDSWDNAVADLKAKANEFISVFTRLKAIQAKPDLSDAERSKVDAMIKRGESVKGTVSTLTKGIDGIANILPKNLLSGAVRAGHLGVLPLIPIAAIAAAIAAMTAWTSDAVVELERLELAEKVRKDGGNPASVLGFGGAGVNWWLVGGLLLGGGGLIYFLTRKKHD